MRAHGTKFGLAFGLAFGLVVTLLLACWVASVQAASPASRPRKKDADTQVVDLLSAISSGQIDVKFIPKDETQATLLVTNKGNKPLLVRLPEAFAGVPVLAQFNNDFFGAGKGGKNPFGGGRDAGGKGGSPQGLGMNNQQGGNFNIPPEKVRKIKVDAVCLDHGKPNPNPRMEYRIVPIESYVSKRAVVEVLKMMDGSEESRMAVQAAAWHLNNGKSWKQLAAMRRGRKRLDGGRGPYFSRETMKRAAKLTEMAQQKSRKSNSLAGKSSSLAGR